MSAGGAALLSLPNRLAHAIGLVAPSRSKRFTDREAFAALVEVTVLHISAWPVRLKRCHPERSEGPLIKELCYTANPGPAWRERAPG